MHFGFHGPPDAWGSKSTLFLLPCFQMGVFLLFLIPIRYPVTCDFHVDPKKLSQEEKEELYNSSRNLLLNICIWVNLLFIYIAATVINVALGKWEGINGCVMAFLICSMFGFIAYYTIKMRRMEREKYY